MIECIRQNLGRVSGLYSLILYGSLVRGDFIPGTSDVDFFAVLEEGANPDDVIPRIRPILEECSRHLEPVEVDIAWEWLPNLRDPIRLGYPYKFLTVYQRDFRDNHVVVLGEDVIDLLPEYSLEEILPSRLEKLERDLGQLRENRKMMHILAGETARLMAFLYGSSLRKSDVLRTLEGLGDEEAVRIYRSYLEGRRMDFDEEFLRRFILSRVERLKKETGLSYSSSRV
ncbi:nucleotidyltransferase domain-containing protein [Thermococcus siculi]|uniref:nucleotidyltransferase domain-containing protein n=1 Tax=Thermococcus siculi TaxID=72803 RepID=UPI001E283FF3|nr:nucleotidyltransferase domain-containing protein [Thermococcus siculi]